MTLAEDQALELDGPGAIVSHAEVLREALEGHPPRVIAQELGVSSATVRRLLRNLRRAGLLLDGLPDPT